jgi:hypothetical protein
LALAQSREDAVPLTPSSAGENITNSNNVDVQTTACSPLGTAGNVNNVISMNTNSDNLFTKSPIASSGLGNSKFSFPLFDENSETNLMFHLKKLEEFFQFKGLPPSD